MTKNNIIIGKFVALGALVLCLGVAIMLNTGKVQAETGDADVSAVIGSAIAVSVTNCDSSNASQVSLKLTPSPTGVFKSNCQTVNVSTNAPGYTLTARSSGSTLDYLNPTTITPNPAVPSTANSVTTPGVLQSDTWGFAVEDRLNFDNSYAIDNASNNYSQLPTSDETIYETDQFPSPVTDHKFYYGAKITTDSVAGTYAATVTYTGIAEDVPEVSCLSNETICIVVTEPGVMALQNRWTTPITYSIDRSAPIILEPEWLEYIDVSVGDIVEIDETVDDFTFRSWAEDISDGFVSGSAKAVITKMPPMNHFTTNHAGTTAGDFFFHYFNHSGSLTSLPTGSFDTSNITTVGSHFFYGFNESGALTSLPTGSFDTSNITIAGDSFFGLFNIYGSLTSLPAGSFDTSNITTVGNHFFGAFNYSGSLTSLPTGSFDTSNITTAGDDFFRQFNIHGSLTSLPAGSFDTSNITTAGDDFFGVFNHSGSLTSLPAGSFDTSNITTVGNYFFGAFNHSGSLTSLPTGSFDTSNITTVGSHFFYGFNESGALTSLPTGSFDTSNITTAGDDFFYQFNIYGSLTSLPTGSFDTSNITTVGSSFFDHFNHSGSLTSLPTGSFDTSNITTVRGYYFLRSFNGDSALTAGKLQAGTSVTVTNKYSSPVTFWQRPNGNPDGTATSTTVSAGGTITFLAE